MSVSLQGDSARLRGLKGDPNFKKAHRPQVYLGEFDEESQTETVAESKSIRFRSLGSVWRIVCFLFGTQTVKVRP